MFLRLFDKRQLLNDDSKVMGYGGHSLSVIGSFSPVINHNNIRKPFKFLIIENANMPVLGRNFFYEFNMRSISINEIVEEGNTELAATVAEYRDLFEENLGKLKNVKVRLDIENNAIPKFIPHRQVPYAFRDAVEKHLIDLEKQGVISKIDSSEWGTPLVPVLKKDGGIRICADYKITINKYLKDTNYPLPRISDIFARLQGSKIFSIIDLSRAYNQIELDEESQKLVVWSTHLGNFIMRRLPFGVKPATGIFQREIEKVLHGIPGVINFLDDIIIAAPDIKTHNERLRETFERLRLSGLKLNLAKCCFGKSEVSFLGHVISESGLKKIIKFDAILNAPRPSNVGELRAFCGIVNYYGKFIDNLASKMHPLYILLKKDQAYEWSEKCQNAFDIIKKEIVSDSVLTHFNSDLPLVLTCDASSVGIGAVLSHIMPDGSEKPIEFVSRVLSKAEQNYGMIQKEALAIIYATNKFYQFLIGKEFLLRTDHKPLLAIFGDKKGIPQMSAGRLQRWALHLSGFHFKIEYVKSDQNVADMLSRLPVATVPNDHYEEPEVSYLCAMINNSEVPIMYEELLEKTRTDLQMNRIVDFVQNGKLKMLKEESKSFYEKRFELNVEDGILMWGHRMVIPVELRPKILKQAHSSHMGIVKTKSVLRSYVWWPGINKDVEDLVKGCESCMLHSTSPPKVQCMPWPVPSQPWSRIHIDYAGPYRKMLLLIILDAKSKWIEVFPTKEATAEFTIKKLKELFVRFGLPDAVVSDNGSQFTAEVFKEFLKENGIQQKLSAPGHPATNGAAENAVKTVKYALNRIFHENNTIAFDEALNKFLIDYRTTAHSTTKCSPAECLLRYKPKIKFDLLKPKRESTLPNLQDTNVCNRKFIEGDLVIVRDYRDVNHPSWQKAFIKRVLGPRNYLCELDGGREIKRHVDQIRPLGPSQVKGNTSRTASSKQGLSKRENVTFWCNVPESAVQPTNSQNDIADIITSEEIRADDIEDYISDNEYEDCIEDATEESNNGSEQNIVNNGLTEIRNDRFPRIRQKPSRLKDYVLY